MSDQTPPREDDLFHACVELPANERAAWLDAHCGHAPALKARVLRLLEAHDRAADRTLQPIVDVSLAGADVPSAIGPYAITGLLGEGGMGVVYDAEQSAPVKRRVAVKVIKAGMDTRQVVARFLAERQALAAMDHPFVAKVLDGGQTPDGRPYFVMERVHGEPLLEYCTRRSLGIRPRVELFARICQAVQHAHQKGVIHRDLKPSNVLVTDGDSGPQPKVIDFGIAKAMSEDAGASSAPMTRLDQRLGTPAYMSPEQAAGADIDTRTDIYALGVILYELITGRVPTDPREAGESQYLRMLAAGEIEPPPPSTRIAGARLPADLDAIVMKALAVERARRYDTAAGMAEDLGRHLRDEPVAARPPTTSYRVRKFVRRHRLGIAAVSVAAAALLVGAVGAGVGLMRARAAEAVARDEAATSAEVSDFLASLFGASDPNARSTTTLREILDRAAARVGTELEGHPKAQVTLLVKLSHVYASLGLHKQAVPLAEQALSLHEASGIEDLETAEAALILGRSAQQLGNLERAEQLFTRVLKIRTALASDDAKAMGEVLNNLGGLYGQLDRQDDAIQAYERALAIQQQPGVVHTAQLGGTFRGLGVIYARRRQFDKALESNRRALEIFRAAYGDDHAVTAGAFENIGFDLKDLKRYAEARPYAERALDIKTRVLGPEHPQVAFAYALMGDLNAAEDRLGEALAMHEAALRIREKALGPDNPRTGDSLMSIGSVLGRQGQRSRATQVFSRAHAIYLKAYGPEHSRTQGASRALAAVRSRP